ncbi:glycosyltransferase family 2 protein [Microlunatus soli]|uniref:glycosyltransferase family 2 protein n=1 Tax=Microlunatus soli TaxID=630515 RepID=UPI0012FC6CA2|nr:glycosyltransferase family 2 protein [Microlunatus soli]
MRPKADAPPAVAEPPTTVVVALIPAHDEAAVINAAISSLGRQHRRPDRIVVVADNCTDNTPALASAAGAEVIVTVDNKYKKAGALNQALEALMPGLTDADSVLIMDADTTIAAEFVDTALLTLAADDRAGGVSSVFIGRNSDTMIGQLQRMEYHRYQREIRRRNNQAFVISGTASLFRVGALREVRSARDGKRLPIGDGYYDVYSLTEDNELTFALRTLDHSCPAPGVTSVTDVMERPLDLYRQRHRWFLGALRNLRHYGLRLPLHLRWVYWAQQIGLVLSVLSAALMITMLTLTLVLQLGWSLTPIWLVPTAILLIERVVTVWTMGWRQRLIAASLLPEMAYSIFLIVTFSVACKDFLLGRRGSWYAT